MLEVGNVGLSVTEQYSMMSLWSLAGAPLLSGTDIVHASATTLAILANKEVTAINQDLGLDGKVQWSTARIVGSVCIWRLGPQHRVRTRS